MNFLYAAELKKRYTCYGHFYEMVMLSGEREKCRSVLEIVDTTVSQESPAEIWKMKPDMVAVMMNPGSSRPKDIYHIDAEIHYPQHDPGARKELVLTQPDNTQYQLMRIGAAKGWRHIRVLNLSDLRDPKSGSFLQRVDALGEIMGGHTHSLFCRERAAECSQALQRKDNTPILLGWGQDPGLIPLAEQCLQCLEGEPVRTVSSDVHPVLNAHPSPMLQSKKLLWLECMMKELDT